MAVNFNDLIGGAQATTTQPAGTPATGGTLNFNDIIGGGSAGASDPVASAQKSLDTVLNDIISSGASDATKAQAQQTATAPAHQGLLTKALGLLDDLRSATVSTGRQIEHAVTGLGWNDQQLQQDYANHLSVGDLLANNGMAGGWQRRALGFLGDVAADPLTYLTLGAGDAAEMGARGIGDAVLQGANDTAKAAQAADALKTAEQALQAARTAGPLAEDAGLVGKATDAYNAAQAAHEAAAQGASALTHDTVLRMAQKGIAGLNPDELQALAERGVNGVGGIGFRVPLTKLASHFIPGVDAKVIDLGGKGLTDLVTGPAHEIANVLKDTKVGQALTSALTTSPEARIALREAALSGDAEGATKALNYLKAAPTLTGAMKGFVEQQGPGLLDAMKPFQEGDLNGLRNALEGDTGAWHDLVAAGKDPQPVRDWLNGVQQAAQDKGVPLANIEHYFPHQLTDAAVEAGVNGKSGGKVAGEFARQLKPGATFLGEPLLHGSVDEINSIGQRVLGDGWQQMFKGDPREVLTGYLRGVARRVGEASFTKELADRGVVAADRFGGSEAEKMLQALDSGKYAKLAAKYGQQSDKLKGLTENAQQARETIARLGGEGEAKQAAAEQAQAIADKAERMVASGDPTKARVGAELAQAAAPKVAEANSALDEHMGLTAAHEQAAAVTQQQMDKLGSRINDTQMKANLLASKTARGAATDMLAQQATSLRDLATSDAPAWVHDAVDRVTQASKPGGLDGFLRKYYDPMLGLWKSYQLLTPGKIVRHQIGGIFNMWLGNVLAKNAAEGFSIWHAFQAGNLEKLSEGDRQAIQDFVGRGMLHNSQYDEAALGKPETALGKAKSVAQKVNPVSRDNAVLSFSRDIQSKAQDYQRFGMFYDALKKGMNPDLAAEKVSHFLFDWGDLTKVEQSYAKRLVPFYTFTRKNLPLQLEQMMLQPGKYTAFIHAKQNLEQGVPTPSIVPQSFLDSMGVRVPWKNGGNQMYLAPDLPFSRIGDTVNGLLDAIPKQIGGQGNDSWLLSQASPMLKLPLEMYGNKPAYSQAPFKSGAAAAPGVWQSVPALMPILGALGLANRAQAPFTGNDKQSVGKGDWVMSAKNRYLLESLIPPLAQARRTFPSQPNQQASGTTNQLTWLLGQNFKTDDPTAQAGELYRRSDILKNVLAQLQNQGLAPQTRTITVKRKG